MLALDVSTKYLLLAELPGVARADLKVVFSWVIKLLMLKNEAMPMKKIMLFGLFPRFPLQSGQGFDAAGPKYPCSHVPMWGTNLPSFSSISQGTMAADLLMALGWAASPLGEVLHLI